MVRFRLPGLLDVLLEPWPTFQGGDAPFPDPPDSFGVPPSLHRPTVNEPPVGSDLVLADLARVDFFLMQEALYILGAFYLPRQVHARAFVRQVAVGVRDTGEAVAFQHGTYLRGVVLAHLIDAQHQSDMPAVLGGEQGVFGGAGAAPPPLGPVASRSGKCSCRRVRSARSARLRGSCRARGRRTPVRAAVRRRARSPVDARRSLRLPRSRHGDASALL